jgi:hypothetical protein
VRTLQVPTRKPLLMFWVIKPSTAFPSMLLFLLAAGLR